MELKSYSIHLDVDFNTSRYTGEEEIVLDGAADYFELDAVGLSIKSVKVNVGACSWDHDTDGGKIMIRGLQFSKITLDFAGKALEGGLHGFYKSSYSGGYFLTTQFEPVGARHLFPCVDNPSWKAIFEISVTVDRELTVISNTGVKSIGELGDKKRVSFEKTPRMSTYLLFVGIGVYVEQRLSDGFDVIAASTEKQKGKGKFAIENARLFLAEYEKYYSIAYPLNKLHLVAVPQFAAGAMENWGAITFREVVMLADETTSVANKRLIASVLAHEIAHQWFGNLVTMKWWNDLWLNESFATYMSSVIVDRVYPKWEVWSDFLTTETNGAMIGDSLRNTHPIEVEVGKPDEINQIFDEISYGKGASVLRMVASYIGEKSFREGVNAYLRKFSYSNATSSDLWKSLEISSNEPVAKIMEKWLGTPGFPVVIAAQNGRGLELSQERFLLNGKEKEATWPIPVHYQINGLERKLLLEGKTAHIDAPDLKQLNLNIAQTGFYRVLYDAALYDRIAETIDTLREDEKWGIASDLFYFLLSGRVELHQYLRFVNLLMNDSSYIVVSGISSNLALLREIVPDNTELSATFMKFFRSQLTRIGRDRIEGEDENSAVLRESLTNGLARYDTEFASQHAIRFENLDEQPPELRSSIGIAYARSRGADAFDPLFNNLRNARSDADAMKTIFALTSFREPELVRKTLDLAFKGDVNIAHIVYLVYNTAMNPEGKRVLWEWFKSNREALLKTYAGTGLNNSMIEYLIARAGIMNRKDVENYFKDEKIPEASRGIAKGLELLNAYSRFREKYGK